MGVFDKFLDIMKLNDDDDYEDDFYDDDEFYEEDDYEEKPRRSLFGGLKKNNVQDDYEDDYDDGGRYTPATSNKITPMRQPASRRNNSANMEVCVVKPTSVDDSREITETLLAGRTVILNLEGMDLEIAQRIIDFISGATFAISGNLQKISNYIFLVTPTNVDISGDLQDLLSGSMEQPTVRGRF